MNGLDEDRGGRGSANGCEEPPSISGGESQAILRTLLNLHRETGDDKFLSPVAAAIRYLRRSQLADGRLARFYELRSNRPLFFTQDYQLTYADDDLPTHYAFIVSSKLDHLQSDFDKLKSEPRKPRPLGSELVKKAGGRLTPALRAEAKAVAKALDDRGASVEKGTLRTHRPSPTERIIDSRTFARNLMTLTRYLAATSP